MARIELTLQLAQIVVYEVLLICVGFSATIDSNYLRKDVATKLALGLDIGKDKHLASQPTISRLESNISLRDCYRIAVFMVLFYIQRRKQAPKEIILDFDGSCFEVHGDRQGTSYRSYYAPTMYFPLFVYDRDGWLIGAILRPGKEGEARLTVPTLKRIVKQLRDAWAKVQIIVRADAAFGNPNLYDWCEDQGKCGPEKEVYYIVCLKTAPEGSGISGAFDFHEMKNKAKRQFGKAHGPAQYMFPKARIIFHALAYNTMFALRENLPGQRQSWTFPSIQKYLLRIPVRVTSKGLRTLMHWPRDFPFKREIWTSVARLRPKGGKW